MTHRTTLHILLLLAAILFGIVVWPYLTPLTLAVAVTVLGKSLYNRLVLGLRNRRNLAAFLTTFLMILVIGVPLTAITGLVTKEAIDVVTWTRENVTEENLHTVTGNRNLEILKEKITSSPLGNTLDLEAAQQAVLETIKQVGTKLIQHAGALAAGIAHAGISVILFILALFFLLRDGDKLIAYFRASPYVEDRLVDHLTARFKEVVQAIVLGNLAIAALQGAVIGGAFFLFGLSNGLLAALATALFALIPAIGALVIVAPATVYLGFTTGPGTALAFAIITLGFIWIIDYVLKPMFLERRLRIHSLIVFVSLLGGISVFGLLGILYGPLIAALFLTLLDLWTKEV